ncbi:MAG: hypothetical protein ABH882_04305 [Candidatus Omnitrophota bacterium]|nr:hypothetical protein [Candidatus Omnitrophota bacterium]MBU1928328.1 hypothetical protein [Candidatus Omnitrophota bacterium]MBU2034356.1 hypothetical protein [Candidatus Omnitrophota bacterium]MBU2221433.1 hypothetical protein [Candidatus Omnitrophota bacterium]MBU2258798.1 hypothetical protein [Candidatus Omnitrophota bacterium]
MFSLKFFVTLGCIFLAGAAILRGIGFINPPAMYVFKPSSLLILANISFVLAILAKK